MRYLFNKTGFTLIEITVVLLILGIALALSAVSFSKIYGKSGLRQDAVKVQSMLRYAREQAVITRSAVTFYADAEKSEVWLEQKGSQIGRRNTISGAPSIEGVGDAVLLIVFYPMGNSSGGIVLIRDKSGGGAVGITVDENTGKSSIRGL